VVDMGPPEVSIVTPAANQAVQGSVTLQAQATDFSGIEKVLFSVREPDGGAGIPIGYEDLAGSYNSVSGNWEYFFDTTRLQDGNYVVVAKATDIYGNEGQSSTLSFSIRNWAIITMLPSSKNNNAGRTMPVKFSIKVAASVDPAQPFVYNEDLEVRIYNASSPGTILQRSVYGGRAENYRIETAEQLYITNFKTGKTPAQYVVEIWRPAKNFMVGSFTFAMVK
jgi:hypothetical protein